ncbi:MAG: sucrose phosphorylase [Burkholderiaceae bacterium]|nr:sucrose phosphorylase [Burkholderiaceae bacterium]
MKNQVQLITYVDRLSGGSLHELQAMLCEPDGPLHDLFGGVHLLPFYYQIDGADAGFDPIDHLRVDDRLGDWSDVAALSEKVDVMADVIVNHVSSGSPQFQDFLARGQASEFNGMFLTRDAVFPKGASDAELKAIYRPRPGSPFTPVVLKGGQTQLLWTTFTPQQIDIDVHHTQGRAYLSAILKQLAAAGVRMTRLDAIGYAIKKAGSNCFMLPETFDFIAGFAAEARALGIEILVEIHSYYQTQIEIARYVDWVYDFALPPLVLHALNFNTSAGLRRWLSIRPRNAVTVLDTHDGIGIIDIGADKADRSGRPGLVPDSELDALVERIHTASLDQSRQATGAAASNLDLYQVNCTFYDALGRNDTDYLIARAIQFFVPGVPQVYYVGLLAGCNDMDLLLKSGVGRNINRHYYQVGEVAEAVQRPVVQTLLGLIRWRNSHPSFQGEFELLSGGSDVLSLRWSREDAWAQLDVDLVRHSLRIRSSGDSEFSHFHRDAGATLGRER